MSKKSRFNIRYVFYSKQGEIVESTLRMMYLDKDKSIGLAKAIYDKYRDKYFIWIMVYPEDVSVFDKDGRLFDVRNFDKEQVPEHSEL